MSEGAAAWADALLAARIFASDPHPLSGIRLRARAGPVRDRWLEVLRDEAGRQFAIRKLPANIAPDRLLGGIDLAATLSSGKPVVQPGLLVECDGGILIVPMAERMAPHVAAALISALDLGEVAVERDGLALRAPARIALVLLDEGEDTDEAPPAAIVERMGLTCSLDGIALRDLEHDAPQAGLNGPVENPVAVLCHAAMALGIDSARAPLLALATAQTSARLRGCKEPDESDLDVAVRLSLLPRATRLPEAVSTEQEQRNADEAGATDGESEAGQLADRIVEAAAASLPADVLAALERSTSGGRSRQSGSGAGALRKSLMRGRPIGARPGKPGAGARLHLVETLRAAAPWQRLRRREGQGVQIRAEDFRIRRFAQKSESTLIFVVDASGSAAAERMGEAKGAVELLLGQAYVKRTQVALAAFRGDGADILLPPTRSLVRAKRQLADMVGGGGTPLAAGVEAGQVLAEAERGRGRTPFVVLMTDGRANVSRDGSGGRAQADADARAAARRLAATGVKSVVIDIASRPRTGARELAAAMGADYAALPRADAGAMSSIVGALAQ